LPEKIFPQLSKLGLNSVKKGNLLKCQNGLSPLARDSDTLKKRRFSLPRRRELPLLVVRQYAPRIPFCLVQRLILAGTFLILVVSLRAESAQEKAFWLDVPYVRQDKNLCGAASVAMVLQYWQRTASAESLVNIPSFEQIEQALRSSNSKGVLGSQMRSYLTSLGYQAFVFKGRWSDIENHISKGRPLITGLGNRGALDHFVVVTGWNDSENVVLINDPARRKLLKLDRKEFEKSWEQTSCWTLLALPPSSNSTASTSDGR
jgi:predicted double-glycine peptidase